MPTRDERMYAMLLYFFGLIFPLIGPLIVWLIKKNESEYINYHGKEYLNFFISYVVYNIIAVAICVALMLVIVGFLLLVIVIPILNVAAFIIQLIALVKAYDGEKYRIPGIFRLLNYH